MRPLHVLLVLVSLKATMMNLQPINYEVLPDTYPSTDIEGPGDQDIQFLRVSPWKSLISGYFGFPENDEDDDTFSKEDTSEFDATEDFYVDQLSSYLLDLLRESRNSPTSLIVVDNYPRSLIDDTRFSNALGISIIRKKKSRYHRKGGTRKNSRSRNTDNYNSSRYLCVPTREDILQLLIALHDVRQGDKSRTVEFCNRRRSAAGIFTNIRFLGRRRK